ncbi:MAG: family N-acetyltransferase [Nocardioides sp.]|nr:family N-acetyltransferase [Nocardioides sp.]
MTHLVTPDARWHDSWAGTIREFGDEFPHGSGIGEGEVLEGRAACELFVAERLRFADPAARLPDGMVPCDYFWIADGDEVIGFVALRHRLNDWLFEMGGHIGYSVRPSRRRQGHAGRALALALGRARELGLDRVLLTCDEDNRASRLTIEGGGGVYEDTRNGKQRFWIDLTRAATPEGSVSRPRDGAGAAPA